MKKINIITIIAILATILFHVWVERDFASVLKSACKSTAFYSGNGLRSERSATNAEIAGTRWSDAWFDPMQKAVYIDNSNGVETHIHEWVHAWDFENRGDGQRYWSHQFPIPISITDPYALQNPQEALACTIQSGWDNELSQEFWKKFGNHPYRWWSRVFGGIPFYGVLMILGTVLLALLTLNVYVWEFSRKTSVWVSGSQVLISTKKMGDFMGWYTGMCGASQCREGHEIILEGRVFFKRGMKERTIFVVDGSLSTIR